MIGKLRYLLSAMLLMVCVGVSAQELTDGGKYYLKNKANGMYLGVRDGADWGTRASFREHAEYVILHSLGDGKYKIQCRLGETYFGYHSDYMVVDSSSPISVLFTAVTEEGNTYYKLSDGTTYFGYDGTTNVAKLTTDDDNALWEVITEEEMIADMKSNASLSTPADATFYIQDQGFSRDNAGRSAWVVDDVDALPDYNKGGNNINYHAEALRYAFSIKQDLAVPAGVYALTAQGFYKNDTGGDLTDEQIPEFFANETTSKFNYLNVTGQTAKKQINKLIIYKRI